MQKGQKRRQEILDSAARLFFFHGFEKTSIDDIIKELGCTKGSFYHHFVSKMQVLEEITLARLQAGFDSFEAGLSGTALERLNLCLYASSPFAGTELDFLPILLSLSYNKEGDAVFARMDDMRRRLYYPHFLNALQELKQQGQAFYRDDLLPRMVWDAHMAFCHTIIREITDALLTDANIQALCVRLINLARFRFERMLDLPFDSVRIIGHRELAEGVEQAGKRLVTLNGRFAQFQTQMQGT